MEMNKDAMKMNVEAFICELRMMKSHKVDVTQGVDALSIDDKVKYATTMYLKKQQKEAVSIWQKAQTAESLFYLAVDRFKNDDLAGGAKYLAQSSKLDYDPAKLRYAYCLTMGIGVKPDLKLAFKIYENLARKKVPCAVYFCGALQSMPNQDIVKSDSEKAMQKLMWSVKHRCKFAEFEQGMVELRTAKNDEERQNALDLIIDAGGQREVRAMLWLAIEYTRGNLLPKDLDKASRYLIECVDLKFDMAIKMIDELKNYS